MTARRRDDGELEVITLGGKTITYRAALLLLVASITPLGDKVWTAAGISRDPSVPGIARIEKRLKDVERSLTEVEKSVGDVHDDVDTLSKKFTMFDVNFTKYRSTHP